MKPPPAASSNRLEYKLQKIARHDGIQATFVGELLGSALLILGHTEELPHLRRRPRWLEAVVTRPLRLQTHRLLSLHGHLGGRG